MKIFITGSSGFIGSELIKEISKNHEIVEYDLVKDQDVLDYKNLKDSMNGCDVVIHLAAIKGPNEIKTFKDYYYTNDIGTFNVAYACLENGIKKLIYSSSTGYYGVEKGIPYKIPIKENNLVVSQYLKSKDLQCRDCDLAYSTSKVIAEQILANFGLMKKLQIIILRFGPIGDKTGAKWILNGITVKKENVVQSIKKAINTKKEIWYEAFTITDKVDNVDISKAEKILNYKPL